VFQDVQPACVLYLYNRVTGNLPELDRNITVRVNLYVLDNVNVILA
jgi:hypothetical protein